MSYGEIFALALAMITAENLVLTQATGIAPLFRSTEDRIKTVLFPLITICVMLVSGVFCYILSHALIIPLGISAFSTAATILITLSVAKTAELVIKRFFPNMYAHLGKDLYLAAFNCAVLNTVLFAAAPDAGFISTLAYSGMGGVGFLMATFLLNDLRDRLEFSELPEAFRGTPALLVTAALLGMAFMGFFGLSF